MITPVQATRVRKLLRLALDEGAAENEAENALRALRLYLKNEKLGWDDLFGAPKVHRPPPPPPRPTGNVWVNMYSTQSWGNSSTTGGA